MTQKEVTGIVYNSISQANRIEHQIKNENNFFIFKGDDEKYMVCHLSETSDSSHSNILTTITECYDWINQNS